MLGNAASQQLVAGTIVCMSVASEIEKLARLRDSGDLSLEEFEQAKAQVLGQAGAAPKAESAKGSNPKFLLFIATLWTITAAMSGASLALNPSELKVLVCVVNVGLSILYWVLYRRALTRIPSA